MTSPTALHSKDFFTEGKESFFLEEFLVKKSPTIVLVGSCSRDISLLLILSVTKKYLMLMCLVRLLELTLPLVASIMVLKLSC